MSAPRGYRILIEKSFVKDFGALPRDAQRGVNRKLDALAADPRGPDSKKLEGAEDLYRVRVGDYRIIYAIRNHELLVLVLRVRHRREVYR